MLIIRYLMVGVANTLVGLGAIYVGMYVLQLNIVHANAIGYSIGILLSFVLNKRWTFRSQDCLISTFIRYALLLAVAYVANLATVLFVSANFYLNPYIAQALGILPYTTIGFIGSRYFVFRNPKKKTAEIKNYPCMY